MESSFDEFKSYFDARIKEVNTENIFEHFAREPQNEFEATFRTAYLIKQAVTNPSLNFQFHFTGTNYPGIYDLPPEILFFEQRNFDEVRKIEITVDRIRDTRAKNYQNALAIIGLPLDSVYVYENVIRQNQIMPDWTMLEAFMMDWADTEKFNFTKDIDKFRIANIEIGKVKNHNDEEGFYLNPIPDLSHEPFRLGFEEFIEKYWKNERRGLLARTLNPNFLIDKISRMVAYPIDGREGELNRYQILPDDFDLSKSIPIESICLSFPAILALEADKDLKTKEYRDITYLLELLNNKLRMTENAFRECFDSDRIERSEFGFFTSWEEVIQFVNVFDIPQNSRSTNVLAERKLSQFYLEMVQDLSTRHINVKHIFGLSHRDEGDELFSNWYREIDKSNEEEVKKFKEEFGRFFGREIGKNIDDYNFVVSNDFSLAIISPKDQLQDNWNFEVSILLGKSLINSSIEKAQESIHRKIEMLEDAIKLYAGKKLK